MRILVIGGTGLTGARVVRRLIRDGHAVAVFHRGQTVSALPDGVSHIYGERGDLPSFADEFKRFAPDAVLDMIAYTEQEARILTEVIRPLTKRVVVVSSMDVYAAYGRFRRDEPGEPEKQPFDENAPLRRNLYPYRELAQSADDFLYHYDKITVERVVMNDARLAGTVLRLPKVYGAGDKQHRTFEYLKRMDDKRPAVLLEEGKAGWRWTRGSAETVAAAIALAVADERAANRIYNIGEAETLTETEWVSEIARRRLDGRNRRRAERPFAAAFDGRLRLPPRPSRRH